MAQAAIRESKRVRCYCVAWNWALKQPKALPVESPIISIDRSPGTGVKLLAGYSRIAADLPFGRHGGACCITTPSTRLSKFIQSTLERCKTVAQTQTSLLVTASSPLWRVATNLHPQQVTVELLVERRGTTYLPGAAKAQQATNQRDVPREEVLRRVDNERPTKAIEAARESMASSSSSRTPKAKAAGTAAIHSI